MELRSPDPACSPYLAFSLLIRAGLDGVERGLPLPPSTDLNLYEAPGELLGSLEALPADLGEAIEAASASSFVRSVLPETTLRRILADKTAEWNRCFAAADRREFELAEYFHRI